MYKLPSIKMAQNQNYGHLQAFPQKRIENSAWKNIALYIIEPANSLCSELTLIDIKDEVTTAHTTDSVCHLTQH